MAFPWRSRLMLGTSKVEALAVNGDVAGLIELAGHDRPRVRAAAESKLLALDAREEVQHVRAALRHQSDDVRCAAIRTLCHWGDAMELAQAVSWLPPGGGSRRLALAAIARLREPKSAPVLAGSLVGGTAREGLWTDEVELVRSLCEPPGNPETLRLVVDVLIGALEVEDDHIADRAEHFLIWLDEDAVPRIAASALSGAAPERAVRVLGQIGGTAASATLIDAVDHPDPRARQTACAALGELGDPASVAALVRATRDRDHEVRVAAASALAAIGPVVVLWGLSALARHQPQSSSPTQNGAGKGQNRTPRRSGSRARVEAARQRVSELPP
jgi:HEAT repeat protein